MDELSRANLEQAISEGGSGNADIVGDLEASFAALTGARFALCTASGTAALISALWAAGVRPGDAVAVSALGPAMTGLAVTAIGARPVFLDTGDPSSFGIHPNAAQHSLVHAPKAAVLVPMWGYWDEQPATLDAFRSHHIPIIIDAAQAPFLRLDGGLHDVADVVCLSLHGRKPFKAGEGGVCLTNHPLLADRILQLRNFGQQASWNGRRLTPIGAFAAGFGVNFKINALGAAWCLTQTRQPDRVRDRLARLRVLATDTLNATGVAWTEATQSPTVLEHGRYGIVAICANEHNAKHLATAIDDCGVAVDTSRYQYRPMYHAPHLSRHACPCPTAEQLTRRAVACRLEAFTALLETAEPTATYAVSTDASERAQL
ncbi:MAG: DegT/DnrJ/EryC1/StrS family aminotransferase [Pseudonocardiaceae bacterium]